MSVRGTKRQQIIAKWLRGEDDPDYEVIPTKDENKYIIKPKHSFKEQEQNEEQTEENETKQLKEEPEEEERHFVPELREPITEPDDEPKPSKHKAKDSEFNLNEMILLELRAIREEQERKREEKIRKKEIKSITKKQLSKTLTQPIYDEEDHETPKPTRRRVNLLSRYVY